MKITGNFGSSRNCGNAYKTAYLKILNWISTGWAKNKAPKVDHITAKLLQCSSMMVKDALYHFTQDIRERPKFPITNVET